MLEHVLRAGQIGPLALPHRIVMGSMHLGLEAQDDDGRALAAFYAERARGGAGLIVTGGSAVSRVGAAGRGYSFVNDPADASRLARVADAVHEAGGQVLLQLFHAGRYAIPGAFDLQPVAPSPVYSRLVRAEPRELTDAEVRATVRDFAAGAARARALGFDGVELMGSEGYLLNQFLAPLTNLRDDAWGGDPERRMAFPLAVAAAVREAVGADRAVVYRISGADLVEGGASEEAVAALATRLCESEGVGSARGVDALNVGVGWHEARVPTVQLGVPVGAWVPWAAALRRLVTVPVIASNRINTLALADEILGARAADFVSLARPFLADPEIVAKGREAAAAATPGAQDRGDATRRGDAPRRRVRTVNVCIACDQACIDRSLFDRPVSCVVNPRAGHELQLPGEVALDGVAVAVAGGGPAGMEAARTLALAGARVTLYEAATRLGGQFRLAAQIPGKADYARTIDHFEAELARLGVAVRLRTSADPERLADADAVIVATGVLPRAVDIPGAELPHVHTYASLLDPDAPVGPDGSVAIIGAGGIGVDVAHRLSDPGDGGDPIARFYSDHGLRDVPRRAEASPRPVTLLRRGEGRVGESIGPTTRWVAVGALQRAGVQILTGVTYERIEPGLLRIRDASGTAREIAADTIVVCAGQERHDRLARQLAGAGVPQVVIGGAAHAGELDAERAFRQGAETPARVAALLAGRD